jgi:hypothetical protein
MQNIFLILGFAKVGSIYALFPVKAKPLAPVSISLTKKDC